MKKGFCLFMACLLLVSCGQVNDAIPVQILADALGEEIDGYKNLGQASSDYIGYCMSSDLSLYEEYIVLYPFAGTMYNEIGIFKLKDASEKETGIAEIHRYLAFKQQNWDTRYRSDEQSKIENASVVCEGRYLLYTILSPEESAAVTKRFEKELKR
ncbi:MAG: DUF4358 domain-containing protein [Clostridia bacterium]|nr:DUF4358 domain-containing protein [Clostridia bacterium]